MGATDNTNDNFNICVFVTNEINDEKSKCFYTQSWWGLINNILVPGNSYSIKIGDKFGGTIGSI